MNNRRKCIIPAMLVVGGVAPACSHPHPQPRALSREESLRAIKVAFDTRRDAIEQELATLGDHPWAGTYYAGDEASFHIRLVQAPKSGYAYELIAPMSGQWDGATTLTGSTFGGSVGDARLTPRGTLEYVPDNKRLPRPASLVAPPEHLLITWGERKYLMPEDEVVGFCWAVNAGLEPRDTQDGLFLLRAGDHDESVVGPPDVPAQYTGYLLEEPILAVITAVGDTETRGGPGSTSYTTNVTLNVGRRDGVLPGMTFRVCEPPEARQDHQVLLTLVEERTSAAQVLYKSTLTTTRRPPEAGWRLTTGLTRDVPEAEGTP